MMINANRKSLLITGPPCFQNLQVRHMEQIFSGQHILQCYHWNWWHFFYCMLGICVDCLIKTRGPWFNIKMSSYWYRKSHCGDKTVVRSSYIVYIVYAPSQWKRMLQCNIVSDWLGAYTKWSLETHDVIRYVRCMVHYFHRYQRCQVRNYTY